MSLGLILCIISWVLTALIALNLVLLYKGKGICCRNVLAKQYRDKYDAADGCRRERPYILSASLIAVAYCAFFNVHHFVLKLDRAPVLWIFVGAVFAVCAILVLDVIRCYGTKNDNK